MRRMKAARLHGKEDLRVENVRIPSVGGRELLLRVEAATICALDTRAYVHGDGRVKLPRILGHEFAGTVEKVGRELQTRYERGLRVTVNPNMFCGRCEYCVRGRHELCKYRYAIGVDVDGAFAEYLKIPEEASRCGLIFPLPDTVSYEEGALVEPLSACLHGQLFAPIKLGDVVTVIGAGPIGIMHVMLAKALGASKVIACDLLDSRLTRAKEFGADFTVNSSKENLVDKVREYTDGHGSDLTIVAVSSPKAQQDSLTIAAEEGRVNFFGGLPAGKEVVPLNTNLIHYKEVRVFGTFAQSIEEYSQALRLITQRRFPLSKLVTHKYDLEEIDKAFKKALSGEGLKISVKTGEQG
jgi:L-iditol 2-dehydrogenase